MFRSFRLSLRFLVPLALAMLTMAYFTVPVIDTAIAHREPGHPKIGAGLLRAPMECFQKALKEFGALHASR
jgi:hypothetical protein